MKVILSSKRCHHLARVSIFFLIVAGLIVWMTGCYTCFPKQYTLIISSTEGGSVTEPGEGTSIYYGGTVVDLVATPDAGYHFVEWTGNVGTIADVNAAITTITINDDYTITANFALEIWDWYDLDAIRDNLDGSYLLMNKLDSTTAGYTELASETANLGKGWQPIGTEPQPFTGSFDGQGYEIRDLFIDRPDEEFVGLFAVVKERGIVEDIGVVNIAVTGWWYVGGLVGMNEPGTVNNCYSTGNVIGESFVGGLVGMNDGGTVHDSYSTGNVTAEADFAGGLVGLNDGGTVHDSYSTGNVTAEADFAGGLVGWNAGGTVSNSYSTGSVTGDFYVGGLVGANDYESNVNSCYSTGSVTGDGQVGGLVGANGGTVSDSYSTGSVTGDGQVGGLVGANGGTVSDSYSTGSVTGDGQVGGLVGENNGTVSDSFWDTETSGQATSDGGTGKNTTEMQDIATFSGAGWNITAVANPGTRNLAYIWNIVDDETYPFLSWES